MACTARWQQQFFLFIVMMNGVTNFYASSSDTVVVISFLKDARRSAQSAKEKARVTQALDATARLAGKARQFDRLQERNQQLLAQNEQLTARHKELSGQIDMLHAQKESIDREESLRVADLEKQVVRQHELITLYQGQEREMLTADNQGTISPDATNTAVPVHAALAQG